MKHIEKCNREMVYYPIGKLDECYNQEHDNEK